MDYTQLDFYLTEKKKNEECHVDERVEMLFSERAKKENKTKQKECNGTETHNERIDEFFQIFYYIFSSSFDTYDYSDSNTCKL